jgi:hypothetical protein
MMDSSGRRPRRWLVYGLVAGAISLLALLGVVLRDDATGRLIWGALWGLVALWWFCRFFLAGKSRDHAG